MASSSFPSRCLILLRSVPPFAPAPSPQPPPSIVSSSPGANEDRATELGVQRWRRWQSGKCAYDWEWKVDEQVYITKGRLQVTPHGCPGTGFFYAGDVVLFPKWFSATLSIDGDYEQHYRFRTYGEGEG